MLACNIGLHGMVKYLIEKGADVNAIDSKGLTPLIYSIKFCHNAISLYLISLGSDIHIKDGIGCNLLHWASYRNNLFMV